MAERLLKFKWRNKEIARSRLRVRWDLQRTLPEQPRAYQRLDFPPSIYKVEKTKLSTTELTGVLVVPLIKSLQEARLNWPNNHFNSTGAIRSCQGACQE